MKLLKTLYAADSNRLFAPGWWAVIEEDDGQPFSRYLWPGEEEPNFDDLAQVIAELAPLHGLATALELARTDKNLVRRGQDHAQGR